ncbi:hypothetical protein CVS40_9594 [Lucilia cuprina]|nr:hypothetical protein CVS40_9594 [Lucilia cuprina]
MYPNPIKAQSFKNLRNYKFLRTILSNKSKTFTTGQSLFASIEKSLKGSREFNLDFSVNLQFWVQSDRTSKDGLLNCLVVLHKSALNVPPTIMVGSTAPLECRAPTTPGAEIIETVMKIGAKS